ncbi:TolB family protein [Parapedobacter soli]|uniref:TolB family protein n=1 Tax=Parapedobacter soli TaxID=416955 RepID=UPI0021C62F82|nr:hypothetical protein [Parapedobacter soli]
MKSLRFSGENRFKEMQIWVFYVVVNALILSCNERQTTGLVVVFPKVSEPIQLTKGPYDHLYASYYGINSWNKSQRHVTVLRTSVKDRLPNENDAAILGLVDINTFKFIPLTATRAWNFQEGCMAHWLGSSPDSLIIYNDYREGKSVSVILNVHTKEEIRTFPYPVSSVSPDGKYAVSINYSRLRLTRPDYGYGGNGQDVRRNVMYPEDDGLFLIDLENGTSELLVSIAAIVDYIPKIDSHEGLEYFCHTLFSRDGSKISWMARGFPKRSTTAFTVNLDGSGLERCFPDGWDGSHYDWLNANELMFTVRYKGAQYAHVLFEVGKKRYKRLGSGLLDYDGHGTFSPDGKWMITDSYPSGELREQKLYLMDMATEAVLPLGRFYHAPQYDSDNDWLRCDLHCRWSPNGDMVGFNSTHNGTRQVYMMTMDLPVK